ncbi:hypothetical protein CLV37_1012 [Kineococcus rhizosphaerae]|uniref:Uncharacterized protein n=1 Tax=Kineococcus rhizosphaerae TaxID=559628 RepID=A0A2T0R9C4_9ACTN|nr:hypothetical protein CLV37_1012 [Kineococcus rhizosphaerae]
MWCGFSPENHTMDAKHSQQCLVRYDCLHYSHFHRFTKQTLVVAGAW